jgi:hypothetical protein
MQIAQSPKFNESQENSKRGQREEFRVMTMVDVRNAFGSVPWKGLLEELTRKNISKGGCFWTPRKMETSAPNFLGENRVFHIENNHVCFFFELNNKKSRVYTTWKSHGIYKLTQKVMESENLPKNHGNVKI